MSIRNQRLRAASLPLALAAAFAISACTDDGGGEPDTGLDTGFDLGDSDATDLDTGPRPDVPIEVVDPECEAPTEETIVEPLWIAGRSGSRDELGAFGKPDAIFLTPGGILIAGDEDSDYEEVHLFDTRTDDPAQRSDFIDPLVDWGANPGPGGSGEFEFRGVSGFAADPDTGALYIVEQGNGRIQVLQPAEDPNSPPYYEFDRFIGAFAPDRDNPGDGEFVRLQAARTDRLRRLFVSDDAKDNARGARRDVQIFDEEGNYLARFGDGSYGEPGEDGNLDEPENFVIDEVRDRVYVCDEGPNNLVVYRYSDLSFITRIGGFVGTPNGVDIDQFGYVYTVDEGDDDETRVRVLEPDHLTEVFRFGGYSSSSDLTPGRFNSPDTLIIDIGQDLIIVADQGHDRIQGFSLSEIQALACVRRMYLSGPTQAVAGTGLTVRIELFGPDALDVASFRQSGEVIVRDGNGDVVTVDRSAVLTHNGTGSVTVYFDDAGEYDVEVAFGDLREVHGVSVTSAADAVSDARQVSGVLAGADLEWDRDSIIHVTGPTTVPEGELLSISEGTLVMLDDSARIEVLGSVEALGTEAEPIYFFASDPGDGWEQIDHHDGFDHGIYRNVFFTHGGDAFWERNDEFRHCCAYIMRSRGGALEITRSLIADSRGKGLLTFDTDLTVASSAYNRLACGLEVVRGEALIADTTISEIRGDDDNDALYLSNTPAGDIAEFRVSRLYVSGTDDDGIDTENSNPEISNTVVYDLFDKGFALTAGSPQFSNVLVFNADIAARMDDKFRDADALPSFSNSTFVNNTSLGYYASDRDGADADAIVRTAFERSIIWGSDTALQTDWDPADIRVDESIVQDLPGGVSGSNNSSAPPVFIAPERGDYRLHPLSPGPNSEGAIGWQGFPRAAP